MSGRERGFAFSSDWLSHAVNCLVASKVRYRCVKRTRDRACVFCEFITNIVAKKKEWFT